MSEGGREGGKGDTHTGEGESVSQRMSHARQTPVTMTTRDTSIGGDDSCRMTE